MEKGNGVAGESLPRTLADRIDRVFQVSRPPSAPNRPWRNKEVVAACRAAGYELSESHLSELRRGIKTNPTARTLEALGWFFGVRSAYFIDDEVAAQAEPQLAARSAELAVKLAEMEEGERAEREAALELQQALKASGVTRTAHRGGSANAQERAKMMRALARALLDDDETADGPS
ncbi:hypothetical protein [Pseudonocardia alni]|uniref:hypothetical protein n=1 Tax=Pseudonocardia alni TaxID=33907 RepID=UPI00280BBE54|nr:hypothetical protein [Pseudonocardia alni]